MPIHEWVSRETHDHQTLIFLLVSRLSFRHHPLLLTPRHRHYVGAVVTIYNSIQYTMAAFWVSISFQLLLILCLLNVSPCVSLNMRLPLLGILRSCRQRLFPSSSSSTATASDTHALALLFEAYDVIQDPCFRSRYTSRSNTSNDAWKIFDGMVADVEATTEGVVAGRGLVAKRDFLAGEVVALYPIHALGYANVNNGVNNGIPIAHEPSQRRSPSLSSRMVSIDMDTEAGSANIIVGTSDLVCFKDEARLFGVTAIHTATATSTSTKEEEDDGNISTSIQPQQPAAPVDYTYAMLDPSERYVFDVNPSRTVNSSMFVAHLVNDAAAADFSFRNSANAHANGNGTTLDDDFDETVRRAVAYLDESLANFNVVMTPFGPPPLMAYVTVKPVEAGTELLATYGLDYWLGKIDDDDDDDGDNDAQVVLLRRLEDVPRVRQGIDRADDIVAAALQLAKKAVRSSRYKNHTDLMERAVADLMAVEAVLPALPAPQRNINRSRWWRWILPKGGAGLD
jgi:hypothetical protein